MDFSSVENFRTRIPKTLLRRSNESWVRRIFWLGTTITTMGRLVLLEGTGLRLGKLILGTIR
jgi:hypothetical protein